MRCFVWLLFTVLTAWAVKAAEGIREFPIATIEALGKELHRRDEMAAMAFDAVFAKHPEAGKLPLRGWITEYSKELRKVYFIQEKDSRYSLAYTIDFQRYDAPTITANEGTALPDTVAKRFTARRTAIDAIPKFMTDRYNFEVLDAPDGKGLLVYALAATKDPKEIIVGGHYRVSVSPDGTKVQQVDALSRSFLVLRKEVPETEKGAELSELMMTHIVSSTPVETHVYLNLLHKIPFIVSTGETDIWSVSAGRITKMAPEK